MKPEWWGPLLVQEKYQEEKACDDDDDNNINDIIIMMMMVRGGGGGGGRGLLQIVVTYKAEISNISEYLNTKYAEDQFINIVKSHASNQPNMNPTIKTAA